MKPRLRSGSRQRRLPQAGFTLIELLVAFTVLALLLALAVPSFEGASLSGKLSDNANRLASSAALARSEAIKRNAVAVVCMSANGTSCATSGSWEQGWIVFHDANRNAAVDAGETVLQQEQAAPAGFKIIEGSATPALSFQPTSVGSTQAAFTVCRATPSVGTQERAVTVSASGRVTVKRPATPGTCS